VTVTDPTNPAPLPMLKVDEPTLTMNFCVNTSPLAGREGKFVTSRQIWDRLQKELQHNVALRVKRDRRRRHLRSDGPRRTAPDHPAGKHAPRRL
jgi:predicted membrane GTPase involved in stress response